MMMYLQCFLAQNGESALNLAQRGPATDISDILRMLGVHLRFHIF